VTTVVKLGGDVVHSDALPVIAADIARLAAQGAVVVHGGGPQSTALQKRLGIEPNIVAGRRITDRETLDVMKMVVGGQLNADLCAALLAAGARPVGLHGASSRAIAAVKRPPRVVAGGGDEPIDFGHVGDVTGFNDELLSLLLNAGHVPVLACIGSTAEGQLLNINADIIANQLAIALGAEHLVLITGARGVMRDIDDPDSRIATLTRQQARTAIAEGIVAGGMIPKLEESIRALDSDKVGCVHVVGKLTAGELAREIAEPGAIGTALLP